MAGIEKTLENWIARVCKKQGAVYLKLTFLIGIPDRLLLIRGGRTVFMELKTPVNGLSLMQARWQHKLRRLGFACECVRTKKQAADLIFRDTTCNLLKNTKTKL